VRGKRGSALTKQATTSLKLRLAERGRLASKRRFVQKQREPFAGILALLAIAAAQFDLTVEAFHQLRRTEPGEQSLDPRRIK
jgi:hypothetical protein